MRRFAVKLILKYKQKCKVMSKFVKNETLLKNKLLHKFYEFINLNYSISDNNVPWILNNMLNLKCQFWYLSQRASLARVGSHIWASTTCKVGSFVVVWCNHLTVTSDNKILVVRVMGLIDF